jgi:hypothetical protein
MTKTIDQRRQQSNQWSAARLAKENDVGPLLDEARKLINWERRNACERDLFLYLQTYFPFSTGLSPFSEDHRRVIARIQDCILTGGRFCEAVYRGFAKTTISQNTGLWAESYGHRKCIPIFGATDGDASRNMQSIKLELETNDLLCEDFPEICIPVRALQGRPQRCASQTCDGVPTHIDWTAEQIVLPTIKGSAASGGIVICRGLTGASRGLVFKLPDGTNQRPDFVIIDDPQTDESAVSPTQVEKRLDLIKRSILKSGGHRKSLACVVTCTVRASNDLVEQLLDHKRNPSWQGERIKMVRRWASEHDDAESLIPKKFGPLWGKYAEIRNTCEREVPGDQKRAWREATEFYVAKRKEMDAGCIVSWDGCFDPEHEVSAIQHAYNILIDDGPDVFATECQNATPEDKAAEGLLTAAQIAEKQHGYERGVVPPEAQYLTAFIDVQDAALPWLVAAFRSDFSGFIVDCGFYPDQKRNYFTLREAQHTLADECPTGGKEAAWHAGLTKLCGELLGKSWPVHGGGGMRIGKCLVDANYGDSTDSVYSFVRQSGFGGVLLPTHGKGIKCTGSPMQFWPKQESEKSGLNWRERLSHKHRCRYGIYDTNFWKSFFQSRLLVPIGGPGSLSLWKGGDHRMLADHLTAEFRIMVEAQGRRVYEWQEYPERRDNHWLDCLVGCCVGASMLGANLDNHKLKPSRPPPNERPSARALAAKARAG